MVKPSITPQDAVDLLNTMLRLDPSGTAVLIGVRQPVNEALALGTEIAIHGTPEGILMAGLLGVINGLFGMREDERGCITAIYDSSGVLDRFELTTPQE